MLDSVGSSSDKACFLLTEEVLSLIPASMLTTITQEGDGADSFHELDIVSETGTSETFDTTPAQTHHLQPVENFSRDQELLDKLDDFEWFIDHEMMDTSPEVALVIGDVELSSGQVLLSDMMYRNTDYV